MATIEKIVNARLVNSDALHTIALAGDVIESVASQKGKVDAPVTQQSCINARGGLVTPALVDPHLHLDLAYSLNLVPENRSGTLLEAIALWSEFKKTLTPEDVCERAMRAIHEEVAFGTGFIRSHVDVASAAELRLADGVQQARQHASDLCEIQLVAFPQDGLVRDPKAVDFVKQACKNGVDLVGGIPHVERTQRESIRHLEIVFDIAAELDRDIDVHIDETDDPQSHCTEYLASMTIERGWQGRVTASHVCALASYNEVHASKVMNLIAEANINVVTNPGVNLHLQGRFDTYPKRRGLTRVSQLLSRGVACAAGQDCIKDPFYPLGTGQMLDQAFLLAHADHMTTNPRSQRQAFDMVCSSAAQVVGWKTHGIAAGLDATLNIFPVPDVCELLRHRPVPSAVIRRSQQLPT
jgi:cytosine/creatinine deaminase